MAKVRVRPKATYIMGVQRAEYATIGGAYCQKRASGGRGITVIIVSGVEKIPPPKI
jgi:uncharacterized protein (UPF0303 family)